ncbi:hypothetical protein ACFV24_16320 [Nocardia fluminea]|uniref:hypothetical protein n=1 Tax=Nocardia fluminea TaxID=134984 RepID=UPI00366B6A62
MFEDWEEEFTPSLRRELDRPRKVLVDLSVAMPTHSATFRRGQIPMRVKLGGLDLMTRCRANYWLGHAAPTAAGSGLVPFTVPNGHGEGRLPVEQWCPQHALSPQDPSASFRH